jgi:hypothetical protein
MPRFIPGSADSSAGAVSTTVGAVAVSVASGYGAIVAVRYEKKRVDSAKSLQLVGFGSVTSFARHYKSYARLLCAAQLCNACRTTIVEAARLILPPGVY